MAVAVQKAISLQGNLRSAEIRKKNRRELTGVGKI